MNVLDGQDENDHFALLQTTWQDAAHDVEESIATITNEATRTAVQERVLLLKQLLGLRQDAEAAWMCYRMVMAEIRKHVARTVKNPLVRMQSAAALLRAAASSGAPMSKGIGKLRKAISTVARSSRKLPIGAAEAAPATGDGGGDGGGGGGGGGGDDGDEAKVGQEGAGVGGAMGMLAGGAAGGNKAASGLLAALRRGAGSRGSVDSHSSGGTPPASPSGLSASSPPAFEGGDEGEEEGDEEDGEVDDESDAEPEGDGDADEEDGGAHGTIRATAAQADPDEALPELKPGMTVLQRLNAVLKNRSAPLGQGGFMSPANRSRPTTERGGSALESVMELSRTMGKLKRLVHAMVTRRRARKKAEQAT